VKLKYSFLSIIILFSGCLPGLNSPDDLTLPGSWRLYDVNPINQNHKEKDPFASMASLKKIVTDGDIISFFEDGRYSEIKGEDGFNAGYWKISAKKSTIELKDTSNLVKSIPFKFDNSGTGKQMLVLTGKVQGLELKLVKESGPMKEFVTDPFYPANNQWRLKPKAPESDLEITNRVANYIKHLALILDAAKKRKQEVVSFEFSQGPVRIYNGGIGIIPYEMVPQTWKNAFYDEADASAGYVKYENYLRSNSYKGAGIGNWIEDDYNILTSIYSGLIGLAQKVNK